MRHGANIVVIIPALNEAQAIGSVLADIPSWVDDVIVADNGSTDSTADVAREAGARVVHEPRRGYGSACLKALAALDRPDIVVFLDGDYSDYPQEMDLLVDPIADGTADMAIGSRVLGNCEPGALTSQQRFGNWLSCALIRLIWRVSYTDLGPFRAIRFDALRRLNMRDPDYGWTVEMQVKAAQHGLRSSEVPVTYRPRIGTSKVSGTLRGVWGAGTKILYTIFAAALTGGRHRGASVGRGRLVVFTRYPESGKVKTRLASELGEDAAAELHAQMTAYTLDWARTLQRDDVDLEVRYEGGDQNRMRAAFGDDLAYVPQGDGDLGARMSRTADEALRNEDDAVVIIGTDCPELTPRLVDEAFAALRSHDLVLGPATDGGYYLIGLRRPAPTLFVGIQWGSGEVLAETVRLAGEAGLRHLLLPELTDVDRPEDLPVWQRVAARGNP